MTFLKALPEVVRPGAQQASWSREPSFSLILQGFSSPRVTRNRSGSDLEGVGGYRAGMEGLRALLAMLECIIIDAEHSIIHIFIDFCVSACRPSAITNSSILPYDRMARIQHLTKCR